MKIISWNVAGLRACLNKGFDRFFESEKADIVCLQETKVLEEQNPFHPYGYQEYLFPAEKKGYSGTMIYTKEKPISVKYGIGIEEYDKEGRTITLEFKDFYLINCYVPNSKRELERLDSRMEFEDHMRNYLKELSQKKHVLYCGDLNVAHEEIDIKNPKQNQRSAGFTIEERNKMTELLESGFIDTFRYFYPEEVKYTWWSYLGHAREKGIGWRLDYFIVNKEFLEKVKDSKILDQVEGSDHCPIECEIQL
ncbi:MAG: exodeoxyribonuclease III [Bacilli bacterium]|nr:exodeoxyribonuclease III [Bacilli bacterium]